MPCHKSRTLLFLKFLFQTDVHNTVIFSFLISFSIEALQRNLFCEAGIASTETNRKSEVLCVKNLHDMGGLRYSNSYCNCRKKKSLICFIPFIIERISILHLA